MSHWAEGHGTTVTGNGVPHRRRRNMNRELSHWVAMITRYIERNPEQGTGTFYRSIHDIYEVVENWAGECGARVMAGEILFEKRYHLSWFLGDEDASKYQPNEEFKLRVCCQDGSHVRVVVNEDKPFLIEYDQHSDEYAAISYHWIEE